MGLFKSIALVSLIIGAILGVLGVLPYISILAFVFEMFFVSFVILLVLQKMMLINLTDEKAGLIYGAVAGFISFFGFMASFLPIVTILALIFKNSYYSVIKIFLGDGNGLLLTIFLIFFIAVLTAMMNAFSGLAAVYVVRSTYIKGSLEQSEAKNDKDGRMEE